MTTPTSRRTFLKASAASAVAASTLIPGAYAAGDETLRVGLVGCGGRGTGAAERGAAGRPERQARRHVRRLHGPARRQPRRTSSSIKDIADKVDVPPDRCFDGFDGYKKLLAVGVDVVLLCTPPGFRPLHLRAAVEAGKHVFCEKPVAVDAAGVAVGASRRRSSRRRRTSASAPGSATATTSPSARR